MNTTSTSQATPAEHPTAAAAEGWESYATMRVDHAEDLLTQIGETIETITPNRREHAADLLDSAIEILTRLRSRMPPGKPETSTPERSF